MDRKNFIKSILGGAGLVAGLTGYLSKHSFTAKDTKTDLLGMEECLSSPIETAGPFPIKTPADLVRSNIISDRSGVPLVINLAIKNKKQNCAPYAGVLVDVWQCDAHGYYSEYGGNRMQQANLKNEHFLRGRQVADQNGNVSFISIYPGWYRGRAPHIHIEILESGGKSIGVSQIAFPDEMSATVYSTSDYKGIADTSNNRDGIFRDSLQQNMADHLTGNITDGYTLEKTIIF